MGVREDIFLYTPVGENRAATPVSICRGMNRWNIADVRHHLSELFRMRLVHRTSMRANTPGLTSIIYLYWRDEDPIPLHRRDAA
jgi:hypothetical protein